MLFHNTKKKYIFRLKFFGPWIIRILGIKESQDLCFIGGQPDALELQQELAAKNPVSSYDRVKHFLVTGLLLKLS